MHTVSCYGYATHAHTLYIIRFPTRSIDGCTLLLWLWTPGCTLYKMKVNLAHSWLQITINLSVGFVLK